MDVQLSGKLPVDQGTKNDMNKLKILLTAIFLVICVACMYWYLQSDELHVNSVSAVKTKAIEKKTNPYFSKNAEADTRIKVEQTDIASSGLVLNQAQLAVCQKRAQQWQAKSGKAFEEFIYHIPNEESAALNDFLQREMQSSSTSNQAAARFLLAQQMINQAFLEFENKNAQCTEDPTCLAQIHNKINTLVEPNSNALAQMAMHTRDPNVYALGFHSCAKLPNAKQGFCAQINARRWTQLDPQNGSAWLYALNERTNSSGAIASGELNNVLYYFSQSKRFDVGMNSVAQFLQLSMQNNSSELNFNLKILAVGAYNQFALPAYTPLMKACKKEQLQLANRRQVCEQVVDRLLNDDQSFISYKIGEKMALELGWSKDKLDKINELADAMYAVLIPDLVDAKKELQFNCDSFVQSIRQVEKIMELGEVAALRKQIQEHQLSQSQLAQQFRAYKKQQEQTKEKS